MLSTTLTVAPIIAALLVMSPPVPVSTVLAAPTSDAIEAPRRVRITVDSEELGRQGVGLDGLVLEQLGPKLQEAGFEVIVEGSAPVTLHVRFEGLRVDEFHYGLHFEFVDGDVVEPAIQWVACMICVDANLRPALDEQAPALIEALEERVASIDSAAAEGHGDGDVTLPVGGDGDGDDLGPVEPAPKPIGPVGIAGAVGLAIGVGLSVGGGIVLAHSTETAIDPSDQFGVERDPTNRGIALLVPGATLVVVGTVMLAVDVSKRARARKRANNVTLVPTLSPTSAGVSIGGRF